MERTIHVDIRFTRGASLVLLCLILVPYALSPQPGAQKVPTAGRLEGRS